MDIASIITEVKKDFTRDRVSVITDFLKNNANCTVISYIKKTRGDSIKFYYIKDGKKYNNDIVVKNAKTLIKVLQVRGIKIYQYNNGKIEEYKKDF